MLTLRPVKNDRSVAERQERNRPITTVWAASFLTTAAVCAGVLARAPGAPAAWVGAEVLGFADPVTFTAVSRERARARFANT